MWKKNTKTDNQNHVCILLHREALSVIRWVLLQAFLSPIIATESREELNFLVFLQMATLSCTFLTLHMVQKDETSVSSYAWLGRRGGGGGGVAKA